MLDFREVLARPDIDSVIIITPDHWHVPMAIYAILAGKDVYVEKPLSVSMEWSGSSVTLSNSMAPYFNVAPSNVPRRNSGMPASLFAMATLESFKTSKHGALATAARTTRALMIKSM